MYSQKAGQRAKRGSIQIKTSRGWLQLVNHLDRCPYKSPNDYQSIFDWLTANVPNDSTKRLLMHLSACCKWAKRSKLVGDNPFEEMAAEIKLKKVSNEEIEIKPFTRVERDSPNERLCHRIITAFETNWYYKHYAPLVKFLFLTGCRPSEALALSWENVGKSTILFDRAVVYNGVRPVMKTGLKTQKSRKFPVNAQLEALMQAIRPSHCKPEDIIFLSPKQKIINWRNFTTRGWNTVMKSLKDTDYRNPYQTRHTFCSLCREADISSVQIAKWVGNSAAIIDRVYARPVDQIQVPEL